MTGVWPVRFSTPNSLNLLHVFLFSFFLLSYKSLDASTGLLFLILKLAVFCFIIRYGIVFLQHYDTITICIDIGMNSGSEQAVQTYCRDKQEVFVIILSSLESS